MGPPLGGHRALIAEGGGDDKESRSAQHQCVEADNAAAARYISSLACCWATDRVFDYPQRLIEGIRPDNNNNRGQLRDLSVAEVLEGRNIGLQYSHEGGVRCDLLELGNQSHGVLGQCSGTQALRYSSHSASGPHAARALVVHSRQVAIPVASVNGVRAACRGCPRARTCILAPLPCGAVASPLRREWRRGAEPSARSLPYIAW